MLWTGLAASTWDYVSTGQHDHDFYLRLIDENGGSALDVGCGTGRLLLSYLALDRDIEGVEASEDMVAICRRKAAEQRLNPVLYNQAMESLDLPRKYRTTIVPGGSFQLLTEPGKAHQALARFHAHLEQDGVLALSLDDPREELSDSDPPGWRLKAKASRPSDGAELRHYRLPEHIDRTKQLKTTRLRYDVVREGRIVEREEHTMRMRLYFEDEIRRLLTDAGFRDIWTSDYDDNTESSDRFKPVVLARK